MTASLHGLFTYPFKSFGGQSHTQLAVFADQALACDRRFALLRPGIDLEESGPTWLGKHKLEVLAHDPRLAHFTANYANDTLTLSHHGQPLVTARRGQAGNNSGDDLWALAADALSQALAQPVRILELAPGHLTDRPEPFVSLITTASLEALAAALQEEDVPQEERAALDPRRFRANLLLETDTPFIERDWLGKTLQIGDVQLRIEERIIRCRATHASPTAGTYDLDTVGALRRYFERRDFGVYGRLIKGGTLALRQPVHLPS